MFHHQYSHICIVHKRGIIASRTYIIHNSIKHYILVSMHENDSIFLRFRYRMVQLRLQGEVILIAIASGPCFQQPCVVTSAAARRQQAKE